MSTRQGHYFSTSTETPSLVHCELCPHHCALKPGKFGLCKVRQGAEGGISLPFFGSISSISIDPIEKKPLYHFRPGSSIFSVGFLGCNLHCPFCQNWEISQETDIQFRRLEPAELVQLAVHSGTGAIAYTYSEPLVHIEYLLEAMQEARKQGLANVLVSNGCIVEQPARDVLALTDAANIDLKSFKAETYQHRLGGDLPRVCRFLELAFEMGVHLEVTTLIVTGMNDAPAEAEGIIEFLEGLSPDIPWHLSAYHPAYKWREPATKAALLQHIKNMVRGRLSSVYVGNVWGEENTTLCSHCGKPLVERDGYIISKPYLEFNQESLTYFCNHCGKPAPFRY
jgi:pyruvate formate lyase activating enzyme